VLLLTDIRTSAKAYRAVVESEKKRAHVNVETLSFASGDIANSSTPCCSFERHFHFRLIVGVHSLHGGMRLLVVRFQRMSPINARDSALLDHRQRKHPIESHH
jgi:hypothetical protein